MPFPGTRVMPDGWSAHHRPSATTALDAQCIITRAGAGGGTTGPDGTWTPPAATDVYVGPCRVVALPTDERLLVVGDAQLTRRRYQLSVEYDTAEVKVGDIAEITSSVDAGLVGKQLRVVDVTYGSQQWQRDLVAEEIES